METCPWRCFQSSRIFRITLCLCRDRCTAFGMTLVTMIFASLGFLSPSNRGGLMVLLWVFMGLFGGYASARIYKMFKGTEWQKNTLKTSFMFPGVLFAIFFVLNALIWGEKSSGAVPFGTMIALLLCCSLINYNSFQRTVEILVFGHISMSQCSYSVFGILVSSIVLICIFKQV